MTELHRNFIAGEWVVGEGIPNINPSNTDEVVGEYARASAADVQNAIAAAKAAFPAWSRSGIQQRHDILKAASDEILKRREEIGRLLSREEGKTLAEASARLSAPDRFSISSPANAFVLPARPCLRCGPALRSP